MSGGRGAWVMLSIWVEKGGEWTWKGKWNMTSTLLIALHLDLLPHLAADPEPWSTWSRLAQRRVVAK